MNKKRSAWLGVATFIGLPLGAYGTTAQDTTTTYRVVVETGSVDGAGTDANVHVTLYCKEQGSKEHHLDNQEDNFERGDMDLFSIETEDLGDFTRLRVRHDNTGDRPGWFLNSVRVVNERTGKELIFPCSCWLATDEGDGRIERVLYVKHD